MSNKLVTEMSREELLELIRDGLIKQLFCKDSIDVVCSKDFYEEVVISYTANQRPEKPYYRKNERW